MAHERWPGRRVLTDVDLEVHAGEIVALAGAMGSGRTALLSAIFGGARGRLSGSIRVAGRALQATMPRHALAAGVALVPEERKHDGLVLDLPISDNLALGCEPHVFVDPAAREAAAAAAARRLTVKAASLAEPVATLSGGNQQKVVLARALAMRPRLLLLDEPTRGVDVGARGEIFDFLRELAAGGLAVLMASSDLEEILSIADRVYVLCEGRVAGELAGGDISADAIMQLAVGTPGRQVA
jgi:ABC-type sugar transport system ATPase subunit